MKKFMAALAAMLLFAGCEEKDTGDTVPEEIPQVSGNPIIEYSADNFSEIDVPVNIDKDSELTEIKRISFDEKQFGEKIPPCRTEEQRKAASTHVYVSGDNSEDINETDEEIPSDEFYKTYSSIDEYTFDGDDVYMIVNYDNYYCYERTHCYSLMRYNTESGDMKEIKCYEDPKGVGLPMQLQYFNGKIYCIEFVMDTAESGHYAACSIDTETGEKKICFEDKPFSDQNSSSYPLDEIICDGGKFFAVDYTYENGGPKEYINGVYNDSKCLSAVIWEMNPETEELTEVYNSSDCYKPPVICNGQIVTIDRDESKKVSVHTDTYDFHTPFRSANLVYADDKEIALVLADTYSSYTNRVKYTNSVLHVYNLEKNEHYSFILDDLGNVITKTADGYLVGSASGGSSYYLVPELGTAKPLWFIFEKMHSDNSCVGSISDGTITYTLK